MTRVVIVGGGFAGLFALRRLARRRDVEVVLVDRRGEHHFNPLLPDLISRDIPPDCLRLGLANEARLRGARFARGEVERVDLSAGGVRLADGRRIGYDVLLLASGAETNFYGQDALRASCLTIDGVEGALAIRAAIEREPDAPALVVGGGYTGVEVATHIRRLDRRRGRRGRRIVIVDLADRLCAGVEEHFGQYVRRNVEALGIEFRPGVSLEERSERGALLTDGDRLDGALAVWTAGVHAGGHIRAMDAPKERQDRLAVDETLRVAERCYAAGDCAGAKRDGALLRLSVQFSISQGHHAAGNILREIDGRAPRAFRPVDLGYVVPMANFRGCGRILGVRSFGRLPSVMHYAMSAARSWGLDNRLGVAASVLAFR